MVKNYLASQTRAPEDTQVIPVLLWMTYVPRARPLNLNAWRSTVLPQEPTYTGIHVSGRVHSRSRKLLFLLVTNLSNNTRFKHIHGAVHLLVGLEHFMAKKNSPSNYSVYYHMGGLAHPTDHFVPGSVYRMSACKLGIPNSVPSPNPGMMTLSLLLHLTRAPTYSEVKSTFGPALSQRTWTICPTHF